MDKNLKVSLLLDFYGRLLSEKQRNIMEYYYNDDLSLSEIADNIGITRQGVHDTVKRTESSLFQMEEKLGLYSRFEQMEEKLERIEKLTAEIAGINNSRFNNETIDKDTEMIFSIINELQI